MSLNVIRGKLQKTDYWGKTRLPLNIESFIYAVW